MPLMDQGSQGQYRYPVTRWSQRSSMFGYFKRRRRERLRTAPFPPEWCQILQKKVPLYSRLDAADRKELHGHLQVFLAEKHFEGCGGLTLTDEIKVTIAAQACLLLLHRDTDYYCDAGTSGYARKATAGHCGGDVGAPGRALGSRYVFGAVSALRRR
jgi:hypothetical protein